MPGASTMPDRLPGTCEELTAAADILEGHVKELDSIGDLEEIPKNKREQLERFLKLSEEISKKFRGDPHLSGPASTRPSIEQINIDNTEREWVRIGLAQIDFKLTHKFPYALMENISLGTKNKIFKALEIAKKENLDIICFPELSFIEEWVEEIVNLFEVGIIVCGSYYGRDNRNICQIIIDGKTYTYAKCHPSIMEEKNGTGMEPGNSLLIFQTKYGKVSVLNCVDFDYEIDNILNNSGVDIIINFRLDIDKDHNFQKRSDTIVDRPDGSRNPVSILHINSRIAEWGSSRGGGGTSIISLEHPHRLQKYKVDGLRPNDGIKYKVCEAKDEMLLIAEINLKEKSEKRTRMGNWYIYKENEWKVIDSKCIWPYE